MSEREKDIVTDLLGRAEQAVREFIQRPEFIELLAEIARSGASGGGLEHRIADSLADQIRRQDGAARRYWGRSDVYVPAKPPSKEEAKQRAVEEARRSGRVVESASRHGISRSSMYRLLKK